MSLLLNQGRGAAQSSTASRLDDIRRALSAARLSVAERAHEVADIVIEPSAVTAQLRGGGADHLVVQDAEHCVAIGVRPPRGLVLAVGRPGLREVRTEIHAREEAVA